MINITSTSVEQTEALGCKIGQLLKAGDVIALDGDLGAGKTAITRGIAIGMGLADAYVCSPTFTIVNEYPGKLTMYHFDTYRLAGSDDFLDSGLDEYFYMGGVCVIEWSKVIDDLLPEGTIRIVITGVGDSRNIAIDGDDRFSGLVEG